MAGAASPPGTRNCRPSSSLENGPDSSLCFQRIHDPASILLIRAHPFHRDGFWASLGKRVYVSDELLTQGVTGALPVFVLAHLIKSQSAANRSNRTSHTPS